MIGKLLQAVGLAKVDAGAELGRKRDPKWDSVRNAFVKGKVCAACGRKDKLNVHHCKPFHLFPELELDPTNLIVLCEAGTSCHLLFGHCLNWKDWNFEVREDAAHCRAMIAARRVG